MTKNNIINEKEPSQGPQSSSPDSSETITNNNIVEQRTIAVNAKNFTNGRDSKVNEANPTHDVFTSFTVSISSAIRDAKNKSFPIRKEITNIEDLAAVAVYDHLIGKYADGKNNKGTMIRGYRSRKTFQGTNVIVLPVNNEQSDPTKPDLPPEQYVTPEKIAALFHDVEYDIVFKDTHMKEHNGLSPRPRFDLILRLHSYKSADIAESVIRSIHELVPGFDPEIDITRVLFGQDNPRVEHHAGHLTVDQHLAAQDKLLPVMPKAIKDSKDPVTTEDIKAVLQKLGITVKYNVITGMTMITGMPEQYSHENAANILPIIISDYLKDHGRKTSKHTIEDCLIAIMDETRVNPVIDMIEMTQRDGHDHILDLIEILGIESDEFGQLLLRKWLHQTVAMAHNSDDTPFGADGVLVLQGDQGAGKTYFFSKIALVPDWFAEGVSIDLGNKDSVIQSTTVWIAELGELDSTLKREQSSLKAFLTSRRDTYRVPYGRTAIRRPRRTSFCGTVNPEEFLNDETGSRRFWVIHVDNIDIDRLKSLTAEDIRQLWRQVYEELYLKDPQGFRLTPEERKQLQAGNQLYAKPLPGEIEIRERLHFYYKNWSYYSVTDVMNELNLHGLSASQVGKALAKIAKQYPDKISVKNRSNIKRYYLPRLP